MAKKNIAIADTLLAEITVLNDLIETEQNEVVAEELKQERGALIAKVNSIYGTDHIVKGSIIRTINNDFINN